VTGGVLLTGGASRRMGADKGSIVVGGRTLAERAAHALASVCDPVVEVGPGLTSLARAVEDPPGSGPLAAFLAGVDALGVDALGVDALGAHAFGMDGPVVVLACDLPFVDDAVVRWLADAPGLGSVVPVVAGRAQYTCARWSAAACAAGRAARAGGERRMSALLGAADAELVDAGDHAARLADIDTPEDARRLGLS